MTWYFTESNIKPNTEQILKRAYLKSDDDNSQFYSPLIIVQNFAFAFAKFNFGLEQKLARISRATSSDCWAFQ